MPDALDHRCQRATSNPPKHVGLTEQSYIEPSVSSMAGQDRFLKALKGGKK